jgi:hypothetical protein
VLAQVFDTFDDSQQFLENSKFFVRMTKLDRRSHLAFLFLLSDRLQILQKRILPSIEWGSVSCTSHTVRAADLFIFCLQLEDLRIAQI